MWRKPLTALILAIMLALSACTTVSVPEGEKAPAERAELHTQLAANYMRRGQFEIARQELEEALKIAPRDADANFAMATLLNSQRQPKKAAKYYRDAVRYAPDNGDMRLEYGAFLCRYGDRHEGEEEIAQVLKNPAFANQGQAWFRAGECHFNQGDNVRARDALEKSLRYNKRLPPALMLLALINFEQKNYMKTRAYVQRYLAASSPNPRILYLGMKTEQVLGAKDLALDYKGRLLEQFPDSAEVRMLDRAGNSK